MNSRAKQLSEKQVCGICKKELTADNCLATGGRLVHKQCNEPKFITKDVGASNDKAGEASKKHNEMYKRRAKTNSEFGESNFVSATASDISPNTVGEVNNKHYISSPIPATAGITESNGIDTRTDGITDSGDTVTEPSNIYITGL